MSFGSSMRFEVKDSGKGGGIFWQKEKPKQNQRKFGYKSKELRHTIRRPEPEYIEEVAKKPPPGKDFIKRNRNQYKPQKDDDRGGSVASSHIKPGTVTLTQDQLNALLQTVGKIKGGESSNLRISIDAENNRLQVETPGDGADSGPDSPRSDTGSVDRELRSSHEKSSGYGSDKEKGGGGKDRGVRFDTARNVQHQRTPEPPPASVPPPLVPWKHMTVAERKRLQWAREKAAEEELQKQVRSEPWGHPGTGAAPVQKPPAAASVAAAAAADNHHSNTQLTKEALTLNDAINNIQSKYAAILKDANKPAPSPPPARPSKEEEKKVSAEDGKKGVGGIPGLYDSNDNHSDVDRRKLRKPKNERESRGIPGLEDYDYEDEGEREVEVREEKSKSRKQDRSKSKQVEDKGNVRPRKPDRDPRHADKDKSERSRRRDDEDEEDGRPPRGGERRRKEERDREEDERERRRDRREEEREDEERERRRERRVERERREEEREQPTKFSGSQSHQPPAAMQSSLFIGQSEPDNTPFLSKKELERRQWLEELNRQREEQRLQKQKDKDKARQGGPHDTWADRFVSETIQHPGQPRPQQQAAPAPFASSAADFDRYQGTPSKYTGEPEQAALPPAAMRSALAIGETAPNMDRIKQKQAEEKNMWLEELNKQREEQREARMRLKEAQKATEDTWAERFTQDPRAMAAAAQAVGAPSPANPPAPSGYPEYASARVNSAPQPAVDDSLDDKITHLRGQNVAVDAVTRNELEVKRRRHLEYQSALKAQIEDKERQKREDKERKWREEAEEERMMKAERDNLQRQTELEDSKKRLNEETRLREVEHLKRMMDEEKERAKEERMMKRLATLKQAGHDVSHLKANYEGPTPDATTPRFHGQLGIGDTASIPGLHASPRENPSLYSSPRHNPSTHRAPETAYTGRHQDVSANHRVHEPYVENRVLTPSRYRHPSDPHSDPASPHREFATQTGDIMTALVNNLTKEMSDVQIEYRGEHPGGRKDRQSRSANNAGSAKGAARRKPGDKAAAKPPPAASKTKPNKQQPLKGGPQKWNYQNKTHKAPVKQSERDPFYEQKRQQAEERRNVRLRHLKYMQDLNKQDPILNPGLVKDHPTARQDQILQQLSSLKQSLIQRQREIETCMSPSDLEKHV